MKTWSGKPKNGINNGNAKLTEEQALAIRQMRSPFNGKRVAKSEPHSLAALSQRFGVQPNIISRIANGKSWKHLSPSHR